MKRDIGVFLALIHLVAFLATALFTMKSSVEQVSLVWLLWFPIDLPWSLFYWIAGEGYSIWVEQLSGKSMVLGYVFYAPYLIHGVIGTIWWYYLPRLVKRFLRRNPSKF
jgi:hypothetical protein